MNHKLSLRNAGKRLLERKELEEWLQDCTEAEEAFGNLVAIPIKEWRAMNDGQMPVSVKFRGTVH